MADRYYLKAIRAMGEGKSSSRPGSSCFDVSNVGYFETTGPIVDAFGQLAVVDGPWKELIGLSSITLFGGQNDRLTLRYPYSQSVFTKTDAVNAVRGIVHALQKIRPEMKVVDAIRELREVTV
jgi:hypothetical protein